MVSCPTGNASRFRIFRLTTRTTASVPVYNRFVATRSLLNGLPKASILCLKRILPAAVIPRLYCSKSMEADPASFSVNPDIYDCISLDLGETKHACSEEEFESKLNVSLNKWKAEGIRGVTIRIPSHLAVRIPSTLQLGFDFHHANPGYVLMLKWLSETEVNNFPVYANQYLGVGGFVVNDKQEVLVIKERFTGLHPPWKYPGGGSDRGEDIATAARREVLEETGVETELVGVLCYRHFHGFRYGCSDTYQACLLRATSSQIRKCDQEILEARWMTLDELGEQQLSATNRFIYDAYLNYLKTGVLIEVHSVPSFKDATPVAVYRASKVNTAGDEER